MLATRPGCDTTAVARPPYLRATMILDSSPYELCVGYRRNTIRFHRIRVALDNVSLLSKRYLQPFLLYSTNVSQILMNGAFLHKGGA